MQAIAAILLAVLMPLGASQQQGMPPPGAAPPPRVTDRARPDFGYLPWAGSHATVVVVFSTECQDCVASIPFYGRLRERIGENSPRRSLVFLTQDGMWPAAEMLKSRMKGFDPRSVASYPRDDRFALESMPSVFLFGRDWKRIGEWSGRLDPAREAEVLAALDQLLGKGEQEGERE